MARWLRPLVASAAVGCLFLAGARPVPAARSDYVDRHYGFEIHLLPGWTQTPTQPGEKLVVAKFKGDRKGDFCELSILRFASEESATTPSGDEKGNPAASLPRGPWSAPDNAHDYLEWVVKRYAMRTGLKSGNLPSPKTLKAGPVKGKLYVLEIENKKYRSRGAGIEAGILKKGGEEYLILYLAPILRFDHKMQAYFYASLRSFRFSGEHGSNGKKGDAKKRGHVVGDKDKLLDPAKRARIKKALIDTWSYIDTPHYIVIYDCDDGLAKFIAEQVEWMRKYAYEVVFPPPKPITECMVVRICKNMDEYHHYGGPQGSAGYWAAARDELVFPDLGAGKKPDPETMGVLHHEAFHQYVYYALVKHDPPVWFNEGYAEYFFCVKPAGTHMEFMKRHPMRYSKVKSALGEKKLIPIKTFVHLSHMQYMEQADLCYAEGWAFATWLKNVTHDKRYREIPNIFFRQMQKGFLEEKAKGGFGWGGGGGQDDPAVKNAYEKAFAGVDMDKLNAAFLKDLKYRM